MLVAFPRQRWFSELTSVLLHTYIYCLVFLRLSLVQNV